ncbi:transglutaminase family protein [Simiduia curdlanivorans]|uniref:Transglutaminase N-terminal domain-containing protein n=1 Tax=Simiduia curdlanivorans TaxID=1492769 RepID=A0ABV8V8J3_9GAMM|nr:transglutaminase family protein [Simiduia curdlanivorans]MDN3638724.1 transglutaminase family protein [Simiduia curdlanivorans]
MRYRIRHITTYKYAARVTHCYNLANLVPRDTERQKSVKSKVTVTPQPIIANRRTDYFGNKSYHFEIQSAHKELSIIAESEVETKDARLDLNLDLGMSYGDALQFFKTEKSMDVLSAREFSMDSPMIRASEALANYARPSFSLNRSLYSCVADLTSRIYKEFKYTPGFTTIATPLSEVLQHKRGVCQDFAHLQVGCLRAMGIPARYVSGYMETLPPPGQEKLVGADATHAWVSYLSPGEGWIEFDPTNNVRPGNQHIVAAYGRDYYDVTPLKGVIIGGGKNPILEVSVDVHRLP